MERRTKRLLQTRTTTLHQHTNSRQFIPEIPVIAEFPGFFVAWWLQIGYISRFRRRENVARNLTGCPDDWLLQPACSGTDGCTSPSWSARARDRGVLQSAAAKSPSPPADWRDCAEYRVCEFS